MYVCTNNARTHYFPGAEIPCAVAKLNAGLVIGKIHDPVRGRLAVRKLLVSERESSSLRFEAPVERIKSLATCRNRFFAFGI
jgi:hypothetical protein